MAGGAYPMTICGAGYGRPKGTPNVMIVKTLDNYHVCVRRKNGTGDDWWEIVCDTTDSEIAKVVQSYLEEKTK